jgi:predicted RND superfamily exporter protein
MLTVLPTIIFVVGMSDVVHILSKYFEELRLGKPKLKALGIAFREIGLATFLTSLTTAVGFLTLLTSSIQPIRNFGLYTAIGVFVAFLLAYSLLPAVLVLSKPPSIAFKPINKVFWTRRLHLSFGWVLRHKMTILLASIVVIALSAYGISRISVNNFILEDLKESHPLKQEFRFFESNLSGARPLELSLAYDDDVDPLSMEFLNASSRLDDYLKTHYEVQSLTSPSSFMSLVNYYSHGCNLDHYNIPDDQKSLDLLIVSLKKFDKDNKINLVINTEKHMARVAGSVGDYGRAYYDSLSVGLTGFMNSELSEAPFSIKLTGTAHLIDLNNRLLSTTMIQGLLIAFLVVALIAGLMFRSIKMVVIALVPNILPLVLIAAVMGYSGIYLKVSTSVVFTIAFGIAVDDTIHFLSKFRIQLGKGHHMLYALKRTYISTGKAIVVTTLILCAGFFSLIFSDFLGTFYIGLLIGLTLVFAVLADLVLLPVLILFFFRKKH